LPRTSGVTSHNEIVRDLSRGRDKEKRKESAIAVKGQRKYSQVTSGKWRN